MPTRSLLSAALADDGSAACSNRPGMPSGFTASRFQAIELHSWSTCCSTYWFTNAIGSLQHYARKQLCVLSL